MPSSKKFTSDQQEFRGGYNGYLGGETPLTIHTKQLQGITIKRFSNFNMSTVQNPNNLEQALTDIVSIIDMLQFKTKIGKKFKLEEVNEALAFSSSTGGKVVLYPKASL